MFFIWQVMPLFEQLLKAFLLWNLIAYYGADIFEVVYRLQLLPLYGDFGKCNYLSLCCFFSIYLSFVRALLFRLPLL